MTEPARQAKIAHALQRTSAEIESLRDGLRDWVVVADNLAKRVGQLEQLAKEFESGRYLPKETDATSPPDVPAVAGEAAPP